MKEALPSRYKIAEYWCLVAKEIRFVIDLGEPSCFACHYYREYWDGPKEESDRWYKSDLERAHIVASTYGGSNKDPANFLLLCKRCHREAPMSRLPYSILLWAKRREFWLDWQIRVLQRTLDSYKVSINEWDDREFSRFIGFLSIRGFDMHPAQKGSEFNMSVLGPLLKEFSDMRALYAS